MTEIVDNTIPYENQRVLLGNMSLRERRISMLRSRGLFEDKKEFLEQQDEVLRDLNGNSYTPLKQYLGKGTFYTPNLP